MEQFTEWTFEGGPNRRTAVGAAGILTRYQAGAYVSTCESGLFTVKLSGTAIIRIYYRLKSKKT